MSANGWWRESRVLALGGADLTWKCCYLGVKVAIKLLAQTMWADNRKVPTKTTIHIEIRECKLCAVQWCGMVYGNCIVASV